MIYVFEFKTHLNYLNGVKSEANMSVNLGYNEVINQFTKV